MNFLDILNATLPVFLIVGVGYLTRIVGMVNDDSEKSIMRLVVNVLYPCFILSKIPGNESLQQVSVVGASLGAGFLLTVVGLLVARATGWGLRIDKKSGLNTFTVGAAIQNYGFIPIPMIWALFGDSADETLGVLFVHNLGLELALWTICIVIISGSNKGALKRLINGPTLAIIGGLVLNFSGLHFWTPEVVDSALNSLGNCTIPISLVLVGAALAGVIQSEKWETNWQVIGGALLVRFAIMPIVFLTTASLLTFSPELKRVLIVESAMPAAIFPIVLAKHYGGKPGVAVQIAVATSIASIALTPLYLLYALKLFGIAP